MPTISTERRRRRQPSSRQVAAGHFFLLIDFQTPVGHIFPRSIELLIYATSAVPLSVTAVIIRRRWFVRETKHGSRPTAVQTTSPVTPFYF